MFFHQKMYNIFVEFTTTTPECAASTEKENPGIRQLKIKILLWKYTLFSSQYFWQCFAWSWEQRAWAERRRNWRGGRYEEKFALLNIEISFQHHCVLISWVYCTVYLLWTQINCFHPRSSVYEESIINWNGDCILFILLFSIFIADTMRKWPQWPLAKLIINCHLSFSRADTLSIQFSCDSYVYTVVLLILSKVPTRIAIHM